MSRNAEPVSRGCDCVEGAEIAGPMVVPFGEPGGRRAAGHPGTAGSGGADLDGDRHAIGEDVEHRGAGPRLLDDGPQLLGRGIALDVEADADLLEAVAHLVVETQDPVEVDVTFDGRRDLLELDSAG